MIKTVKLDSVFEMGEGTNRHRLIAEWHETVGIGYPKADLATCLASEKELWPELSVEIERLFSGYQKMHITGWNCDAPLLRFDFFSCPQRVWVVVRRQQDDQRTEILSSSKGSLQQPIFRIV